MITSEGKTANRNLRIYRPDVTLEEICRTNGPAIVRSMIPCFPNLSTDFNGGKNSFSEPRFSFVYGVNVRTPRVNSILPFSTSYVFEKNDNGGGEGRLMDQDKSFFKKLENINVKVPDFTDKYEIRELFLYATIHEDGTTTSEDIVILTQTTDRKLSLIEFENLKATLSDSDNFFMKQVNAHGIKERAYMWLTSEDYNVNKAGKALSNIIAISDDYDAIAKYIMPQRINFINLLFLIKARYLFDTEMAQRKTAVSSAKAAIMSRNMSHNLGSHVMAYLKQHLNSVQDMVRDNILASLITSPEDLTKEGLDKMLERLQHLVNTNRGMDEVALPFLVGLGKFVSYLQERQDFIATIATDYVPYFSTVNFKDFVYDELNPDLRYARHKDRIGLQPDNILLGNIARSEGLARATNPTKGKRMSDIVIKYRDFDGLPILDSTGDVKSDFEKKSSSLNDMRDFTVYLPGGVVGRQAIFSIVENVIRNAAKHGKWDDGSNKNLELTFDRFYPEDFDMDGKVGRIATKEDYVPEGDLTFWEFFKTYYAAASDINDLCVITLTDNMSFEKVGTSLNDSTNLASIRKALIEPYIDNASVTMLQTNKGIKEMRISASWMRGIDDDVKINPLYIKEDFDKSCVDPEDHWIRVKPEVPEEPKPLGENATPEEIENYQNLLQEYEKALDEDKNFDYQYWKDGQWINRAPVLMVRACAESPDSDYHLQYIFCLPRPKKVAIVLANEEYEQFKTIRNWFAKNNWSLFSVKSFIEATNKSFEFILLSDNVKNEKCRKKGCNELEDAVNLIRRISPSRIYQEHQIKDIIKIDNKLLSTEFTDFKNVEVGLYKKLSDFDAQKDFIIINDVKAKNHVDDDKPSNVLVKEGAFRGRYLYRTHNETEVQFAEYLSHADKETVFVEGITGNNSTDRLVRNDKIDELWLYKQLHAMKTTVGIFDERIFSKIYKKDEADIRLMQSIRTLSFIKLKDFVYKNHTDIEVRKLIRKTKNTEELCDVVGRDVKKLLGDYMSIAYEKKGVSVFNLLKTNGGLEIYGFDKIELGKTKSGKKYYGGITKVGEIGRKENGHIFISNPRCLRFDYLTIHQGLLDKIYEQLEIRHNPLEKHEFTKLFYETFCTSTDIIEYCDELVSNEQKVYFLPNLRIHSGRSKPSFADMPQQQPFIQYAAIEHAVLDCKYSLIELLDFARYE